MATIGDWSDHDDKKYIGKIDRIYVSMSEYYEVEYFIDSYLDSRGFDVNNKNRNIIRGALEEYPGRTPFRRDQLQEYLDKKYKK